MGTPRVSICIPAQVYDAEQSATGRVEALLGDQAKRGAHLTRGNSRPRHANDRPRSGEAAVSLDFISLPLDIGCSIHDIPEKEVEPDRHCKHKHSILQKKVLGCRQPGCLLDYLFVRVGGRGAMNFPIALRLGVVGLRKDSLSRKPPA